MIRPAVLILLCLWLLPGWAAAQPALPALFDVTDVAADDRLNVRAAPSSGAAILGSYGPRDTGIEVVRRSDDGRWGQVNIAEGQGWVFLSYLAEQPAPDGPLPPIRTCFGTEPFWDLRRDGTDRTTYSTPDQPPLPMATAFEEAAPGGQTYVLSSAAPSLRLTGTIRREACWDGMSDRRYGFSAAFVLQRLGAEGDSYSLRTGCCRLQDRP